MHILEMYEYIDSNEEAVIAGLGGFISSAIIYLCIHMHCSVYSDAH